MNDKPLSCTIKNPVPIIVDSRTSSQTGCKILDISFPNIVNPEVGEIRFQNYYVAFLTVKVKFKIAAQTPREEKPSQPQDQGWRVVLARFPLMPDPHTETRAQDLFSLTSKHFQCELSNMLSLRLILQQPSPVWKEFKLEELKLFRTVTGSKVQPLPSWVMEEDKTRELKKTIEVIGNKEPLKIKQWELEAMGISDLNALSSNLQQLWALAEEAAANQTDESLGRYEVDGCYDINLLAYS